MHLAVVRDADAVLGDREAVRAHGVGTAVGTHDVGFVDPVDFDLEGPGRLVAVRVLARNELDFASVFVREVLQVFRATPATDVVVNDGGLHCHSGRRVKRGGRWTGRSNEDERARAQVIIEVSMFVRDDVTVVVLVHGANSVVDGEIADEAHPPEDGGTSDA